MEETTDNTNESKERIRKLDIMNIVVIDTQNIINKIQTNFLVGYSSREKSLVITKLEEAILWAKKDIELHHKL